MIDFQQLVRENFAEQGLLLEEHLFIPCPGPPLTDQEIENLYQDESLGDAF